MNLFEERNFTQSSWVNTVRRYLRDSSPYGISCGGGISGKIIGGPPSLLGIVTCLAVDDADGSCVVTGDLFKTNPSTLPIVSMPNKRHDTEDETIFLLLLGVQGFFKTFPFFVSLFTGESFWLRRAIEFCSAGGGWWWQQKRPTNNRRQIDDDDAEDLFGVGVRGWWSFVLFTLKKDTCRNSTYLYSDVNKCNNPHWVWLVDYR